MTHIVRRVRQAGVYFVTSRAWQGRTIFRESQAAQILLEQILNCRDRGFYKLHAFVIMPDHLHALLTPSQEASLEKALQMIKGGSSHRIKQEMNYAWPVWQQGFHDRWIRDDAEYHARLEYVRMNPIAAKLTHRSEEYALSSACGKYPMDASEFECRTSGAEAPTV
jgi:putative transposase